MEYKKSFEEIVKSITKYNNEVLYRDDNKVECTHPRSKLIHTVERAVHGENRLELITMTTRDKITGALSDWYVIDSAEI